MENSEATEEKDTRASTPSIEASKSKSESDLDSSTRENSDEVADAPETNVAKQNDAASTSAQSIADSSNGGGVDDDEWETDEVGADEEGDDHVSDEVAASSQDNDSGLDVFDDLIKKPSPAARSRSSSVPPPPPASRITRPPASMPPPPSKSNRPPAPMPPAPSASRPAPVPATASAEEPEPPTPRNAPVFDDEAEAERSSRAPQRRSSPAHKNVLAALGKRSDSSPPGGLDTGRARRSSSPPVRRRSAPNLPLPAPPPAPTPRTVAGSEPDVSRPASLPPPPHAPERPTQRRASETPPAVSITKPPMSLPGAGGGRGLRLLLAAAVLLVLGGGATFALMPKSGTLVVSASGPHGRMLPSVEIFVDQVKRCSDSPCRVEDLSDGVHIVEAKAPGYVSMAGKAVKVAGGEEAPFDLELELDDTRAAPGAAPAKKPDDTKHASSDDARQQARSETQATTKIEDLEPDDDETRANVAPPAPAAANQPAPANQALARKLAGVEAATELPTNAAQPASTKSTLNINSIPAASVVLNGMPLGQTPRVGVAIDPGAHTVVFVHPEHGRKVVQVLVEPGQTQTAAVKFP